MMINGSSCGFFQSSRGLRQGDPLSSYLFMIVMEAFSQLMKRAVDGGFLLTCRVGGYGREGVIVSHLLLVDDTVVFVKDDHNQLTFLCWLLTWFEAMSGLKINLEKSELIPLGRVENVEMLAVELGCKVGRLPSTYFGLPLGTRYKSVRVQDGVEERLRKRLALRKSQYISKGGRATLIKSTLSNLPTYFLSLLHIPKTMILRLEQIQRNFLWGKGR